MAFLRHSVYYVTMPYGKESVLFHANSWVLFISWLDRIRAGCEEVMRNTSMYAIRCT